METSQVRTSPVPPSTLIVVVGSIVLAAILYRSDGEEYVNEALHATIEAIGGCIAISVAALLIMRWLEDGPSHFIWMATALVTMGLLDLAHACIGWSPAFFWSRALPTLLGGVLMALVWLPTSTRPRRLVWLRPPLVAALLTVPVCGLLVLAPDEWPSGFAADGTYYWWAKAVNIAGGVGFAIASVFFLRRNRAGDRREADLVFGNHSAIFAVAAMLFGISHIWSPVWWLFHLLRLAAFIVVLKFNVDVFRRAMREGAELRQIEFERRLVGIVGHDLRNPLNAIMLSGQMLQGLELPPRAGSILQRLTQSAERMHRLIAELLDFSHTRSAGTIPIHRGEVDLRSLCATVCEEFAASHPDATIRCSGSGDALGEWDRERLQQMLVNLIENAIKHGDRALPVELVVEDEGDRVAIEVRSHGKPIPEDLLPHIFQPFRSGATSSNSRARSHGLGLFIVNEIVRGHGGEIVVMSSAEDGTTFRVMLPRATDRTSSG